VAGCHPCLLISKEVNRGKMTAHRGMRSTYIQHSTYIEFSNSEVITPVIEECLFF
jgi:hypothetical protein